MKVTTVIHYVLPFLAFVGGALILLMPRLPVCLFRPERARGAYL